MSAGTCRNGNKIMQNISQLQLTVYSARSVFLTMACSQYGGERCLFPLTVRLIRSALEGSSCAVTLTLF